MEIESIKDFRGCKTFYTNYNYFLSLSLLNNRYSEKCPLNYYLYIRSLRLQQLRHDKFLPLGRLALLLVELEVRHAPLEPRLEARVRVPVLEARVQVEARVGAVRRDPE